MMKLKSLLSLSILFVFAWAGSSCVPQDDLESVRIASGGHIVHFLPFDLAIALGFFEDEGLRPRVTHLRGGSATANALISGQVDFSLNSIDHAFKAAVQGKDDVRMVVLLNQVPGMVLVADSRLRDEIKEIADLSGRPLGVTSRGSATHMVLAALLKKNGVDPDNVQIVDAGSSTFPPNLERGTIAGGMALEPFASIMIEQGNAFPLLDLNTLTDTERVFGAPYNQAGVLTRQSVIDRNPDLVERVVRVHVRALQWIQDHSPEEIAAVLPAEVVGTDRQRYIQTLSKLREFYSPNGYIDPRGVQTVYESMVTSGSLDGRLDKELDNFFHNRFLEIER